MDNLKRKIESDPDYSDISEISFKKPRHEDNEDVTQSYNKVINTFQREFHKEICYKREEIHKIQQRLLKAQKTLHLLRYVVVKSFYDRKDLKVTNNEIPVLPSTSSADPNIELNSHQNRLHPALKKLVGKAPINYEPYRTRNKINLNSDRFKETGIKIKEEPITESADFSQEKNDRAGLSEDRKDFSAGQEDLPVRNREKNKYTILVGNISKWITSNSTKDNSTHKWMVYVRSPKDEPDISTIVQKVRFFLHPSYQPNDIVDIQEAPFHLSRRGWGEFPIRVQIYFKNNRNKPIDIIHNIKLDRNYTGRQTMGAETLVDVWLYDRFYEEKNPILETKSKINLDLIKSENFDDDFLSLDQKFNQRTLPDKIEPSSEKTPTIEKPATYKYKCDIQNCDSVNQFIESCLENIKELDNLDKETKMIYEENCDTLENSEGQSQISLSSLLAPEMDQNEFLDSPVDNPMSLLNLIGIDQNVLQENTPIFSNYNESNEPFEFFEDRDLDRIYLEDHCYTKLVNEFPTKEIEKSTVQKSSVVKNNLQLEIENLFDTSKYKINLNLKYFSSIPQMVYFLFKQMPLVTELANDFNYTCLYPYAAVNLEQYLSWNSCKQFCAEWYRAKQIKKYLTEHKMNGYEQWTTKVILQFGQAHGFSIIPRHELFSNKKTGEAGKTVPNQTEMTLANRKNTLTELISIRELLDFNSTLRKTHEEQNEEIDILETKNQENTKSVEIAIASEKSMLNPIITEENLPLSFVTQTVNQIGINLESEDSCDNSTESVILKSVMCLAEELIRKSLANNIIEKGLKSETVEISKMDIFNVLLKRKEFNIFLNFGLGKNITV